MIEVSNLVTPSPEQWNAAINGMRNPFKSRDKSDSGICNKMDGYFELCNDCPYMDGWTEEKPRRRPVSRPICGYENPYDDSPVFVLGEKDKKLLLNLCKAGDPSHRKVLRQLPVIMDIKAPLFFWKQLDQNKVGTCTNSESTMHTLIKKKFEESDFSFDHFNSIKYPMMWKSISPKIHLIQTIELLNQLRDVYLEEIDDKEIRDVVWNQINELLPQSYRQLRTWSANYEVLVNIIIQRIHHKLPQWRSLIIYWLRNVPYLLDIIEALEVVKRTEEAVYISDTNEQLYQFAA